MNRKFKFLYYFLVTVFTIAIGYQVFRLVDLIVEKTEQGNFIATDSND